MRIRRPALATQLSAVSRVVPILCVASVVSTSSIGASVAPAHVHGRLTRSLASSTPFQCATPTVYLAQGSPTQLYNSRYGSGSTTFAKIGDATGWTYNALGYDSSSRFLYGVSVNGPQRGHPAGHLLRIESTGAVIDLGAITGDPYISAHGATNGAFSTATDLWITSPGNTRVDEIDVSSSGPRVIAHVAMEPGWLPQDFTFDDGFMWGLASTGSTTKIYRLDLGTGKVTAVPAPSGVSRSASFGGAWTDGNGNVGFNGNSTGDFYQFSLANAAGGEPKVKLISIYSGPQTKSQDDTAACVPPKVDLGLAIKAPGSIPAGTLITWSLHASNSGPGNSSGYVIRDHVPAGVTSVSSNSPGCTELGSDVTCTEGALAKGTSVTYQITGSAPDSAGVCVTNTATLTGNEKDPAVGDNVSTAKTCTTAAPDYLVGVKGMATDREGYCAVLSTGGVDCWGDDQVGELGDGQFRTTGSDGSATPVRVLGVSGGGALTGVDSLASAGSSYCAVLTSGGVDCWGSGSHGELGNGQFYTTGGAAIPVPVVGIGGVGLLSNVRRLYGGGYLGYCAILTSGGVDCWGDDEYGELGNGTYARTAPFGSATPVQVEGIGGIGALAGAVSLEEDNGVDCALLASHRIDCWGAAYGPSASPTPVAVTGIGGTGVLAGVSSFVAGLGISTFPMFCAVISPGGVDCWGWGYEGELGNGTASISSAPVQVKGIGGKGLLSGVASLGQTGDSMCAVLVEGGIDCWGDGSNGRLGNGGLLGSSVPVAVQGLGGSGVLRGAVGLTGSWNGATYCARLDSGSLVCWGYGVDGELGNGKFYSAVPEGSATPVQVRDPSGGSTLDGATDLWTSDFDATSFCALLTTTAVDCWGDGQQGELGDGDFHSSPTGSALPVAVEAVQ